MFKKNYYKYIFIPLILIVAGIYLLYLAFLDIEMQAINRLHKVQLVHAVQAKNNIKYFFTKSQRLLEHLAQQNSIQEMNKNGELLLEYIYRGNSSEINAVTRIDTTGKIIFTYPYNKKLIGSNIYYQEHIKRFLKTKKPVLSNVFRAVQGFDAIAFYVPIYKKNVFVGGLAILVRFDILTKMSLKEISINQTGFAWLMNQESTILYHPNSEYLFKKAVDIYRDSPSTLNMIEKATNGVAGTASIQQINDRKEKRTIEVLFYPVNILDSYWTIIISTPKSEVIAEMQGFLTKWSIIFIIIIAVIVFYSIKIMKAKVIINEEVERKKAERALETSEKKFRTLVEASPDSIVLADLEGKIIICNQKTAQILGYTFSSELIGKRIKSLVAVENHVTIDEIVKETLNKNMSHGYELSLLKKDNTSLTVEINTALIFNEKEEPVAITALSRDITERKKNQEAIRKAKEEAEKSDKLKSEFLAQMSHEIRSPINTILSFAGLIKEELYDSTPDDMKISFVGIENAGKRIIRTIDLILNMSEIQIGTYEPYYRQVNILKDVLEKLYLEFKANANSKGLELNLINKVSYPEAYINGDEYTIVQIFENLVNNAVKYTSHGYISIILDYHKNKKDLIVEIKDTGIGISKDYLPNLFKPFGQEEQGYTRRYEGNGLGLALVKKYCEINKLDIEVESIKGKGSTFRVIFKEYSFKPLRKLEREN